MDSGSSCLCDSSDPTDPTEYLEILKKKYLERTAKLQAQQRELEQKIGRMEAFIGKSKDPSKSLQSSCQCTSPVVPKVFPETPVRDVPTIPKTMTDVIQNQKPVSQQCSFFQKMMENAKNILSMSCQCPTSPNVTQATTTETPTTTNATTTPPNTATATSQNTTNTTPQNATTTGTDATDSELPTKDNERSEQQNVVDYDNTLTEKSSRTSTCSCEFSDPSTLQEASCSCHIADPKANTKQQSQQVSIEQSSTAPKEQTDALTSSVSKTEKCPWKNTVTSELISEECSCELCKCTSSLVMDGKTLDTDNGPAEPVPTSSVPAQDVPEKNIPLPTVTVFLEKGNTPDAEVQVAATLETKGVHSDIHRDTASKCVTCCRNAACPKNQAEKGKGDNLSAGVQVAASTTSKGVNFQQPASIASIGTDKIICRGKCNPGAPPRERRPDQNQDQQAVLRAYEPDLPNRQDGQNQCAFIGSPLLPFDALGTSKSTSVTGAKRTNTATSSLKLPCNCNTPQGPKKICPVSNFSLNSNDIVEMQTIAELAKKEKEIKAHIADLQKREKQYQEATRDVETLSSKTNGHCCCCCNRKRSPSMDDNIEKIGRELRLENQILKSELEEMKLQLKHCLEKIEGPMKQKLETEKQKCECLQRELQAASKNMLVNQDANAREMNQLKLQLCCACNNITELNQMNQRLKDEMSHLDCLCQKLEDDLIKQKVSEAETIKRLTGRKYGGEAAPRSLPSEEIRCDSSLDVIARKLSKTLKELGPCDECSKLPSELAGAARCIKDLTDMVRKRRTKSLATNACTCQSRPPSRPPSKSYSEEDECCTCCGPRDGGGESARKTRSPEEKIIKTLHQVPESFVQKDQSSKFDVRAAQSSYYSAQGEPMRQAPCTPCFQSKASLAKEEPPKKEGKRPCGDIGEPCRTGTIREGTIGTSSAELAVKLAAKKIPITNNPSMSQRTL